MKTFLPKYFLIGLCAYLMKLALSLDRSLDDLELFRSYSSSSDLPPIAQVIAALRRFISGSSQSAVDLNFPYEKPSHFSRLSEWVLKGGASFDPRDLQQICLLLESLTQKLDGPVPSDRADFVPLRLALSQAAIALSERIFFSSRRDRTLKVTHLNQSPNLTCESIQEICDGNVWP